MGATTKTTFSLAAVLIVLFSGGTAQEKLKYPYTPTPMDSVRTMILDDLNKLVQNAAVYRRYPKVMGGGQGSFEGYGMPAILSHRYYAEFSFSASHDSIEFNAVSKDGYGTIRVKSGPEGKLSQQAIMTGTFKEESTNPQEQ